MARKKTTNLVETETDLDLAAHDSDTLDTNDTDTAEEAPAPRRGRRPASGVSAESIGSQIATGITEGFSRMAPKRIKPGSSLFDPKSAFRSKKGPTIRGVAYQNGILINQDQCYDKEIELLNAITTSGRYIDRRVEVIVSDDAGARVVLIRYPDKTFDQRMENKGLWRSFMELLEIIVKEQKKVVAA